MQTNTTTTGVSIRVAVSRAHEAYEHGSTENGQDEPRLREFGECHANDKCAGIH